MKIEKRNRHCRHGSQSAARHRGGRRDRPQAIEALERRLCLAATFSAAANVSLPSSADFVDVVDLNHDGKFDLVVSSYAGSRVSVLLGNGNGTFQSPLNIGLASAPDHVTTGDVNGDGHVDLITTSFDGNNVAVLLGNGNGTFQAATYYAAGTGPRMVVLGDFNGDGSVDLAVAKSFAKSLTILRNNGNGTFQAPLNANLSFTPVDLVAADFNGDGKLDLAAADFQADRVAIMLGNGNATFQAATTYISGAGPSSIAVGDFNGDGKRDIVTANYFGNSLSVFLGNGNGTFQSATSLAAGSGATYVAAADLDGDGTIDLVAANANADTLSVRFNGGSANFGSATNYSVGDSPRSIAVANVNGGGIDLAVANQGSSNVSILLGDATVPPPTANPGGPYNVNEGSTVQLSGLASTGSSLTYEWDLDGDGIYGETGAAAKRGNETGATPTFSAVGLDGPDSRTVRLRVMNVNGTSEIVSTVVWIQNVAPTLVISGAGSVNEGATYTLSLSATDPGVDTISNWVINWGDGTTSNVSGNPSSVTKVYADNGNYTISATATDEDGTYSSNSINVNVANVPPTLLISGAALHVLGGTYTLNLSKFDPGDDTISSWTINWGDGTQSVVGNVASAAKVYSAAGLFTITASATDEDGTYSANSLQVTVRTPPTAVANGPYFVYEGSTVQLSATGSTGTGLVYQWDLDSDGVYGETGAAAKRGNETGASPVFSAATIDGPDSRTIYLRVTDSYGLTGTATATVWILNVPPTLTVSGPSSVTAGSPYQIQFSASDVASDTVVLWEIDWGDGTNSEYNGGTSTATKTYSSVGTYQVVVTATDEDGSYSAQPLTVNVVSQADTAPPVAVLSSASTVTAANSATYSFVVSYSDNFAVNGSSLDSNDILVTGPNGFSQLATFVSSSSAGGGALTATYRIAVPGGSWEWQKNGQYTISLRAAQVSDSSGNFASASTLGSFEVAIVPPDTAGNSFATARTLSRDLAAGIVRATEDIVGPLDTDDYYRIYLLSRVDLSIKLLNLTDRADLWLYDGNGALIASSQRGGLTYEFLSQRLDAGKYFIRVGYVGDSIGGTYRLRVAADAVPVDPGIASAVNLGTLATGAVSVSGGDLTAGEPWDYYKFSLTSSASVYVKLSNLLDNADLQILDAAGQVISGSSRTGTADESIRLTLAAGTYYLRISLAGTAGTDYRLRVANEGA